MRVFFDSSAFAKRYIEEAGTAEVLLWCDRASELALSIVAIPEIVAAFRRMLREGRIDEAQYRQLKGNFLADIADAVICETSSQVIQAAIEAIEEAALRGMDALHVGAALANDVAVFVSADLRQCEAARKLGLQVVQINA